MNCLYCCQFCGVIFVPVGIVVFWAPAGSGAPGSAELVEGFVEIAIKAIIKANIVFNTFMTRPPIFVEPKLPRSGGLSPRDCVNVASKTIPDFSLLSPIHCPKALQRQGF